MFDAWDCLWQPVALQNIRHFPTSAATQLSAADAHIKRTLCELTSNYGKILTVNKFASLNLYHLGRHIGLKRFNFV